MGSAPATDNMQRGLVADRLVIPLDPIAAAVEELCSARQLAARFGITPQQLRRLAKKRGVGHQIDGFQVFTPADVAVLTERRPGRLSTFRAKGFAGES